MLSSDLSECNTKSIFLAEFCCFDDGVSEFLLVNIGVSFYEEVVIGANEFLAE